MFFILIYVKTAPFLEFSWFFKSKRGCLDNSKQPLDIDLRSSLMY